MEHFVIGQSEDVEAEYAYRADEPVTLLCLVDGEPISVEGFFTIEYAQRYLEQVPSAQIELI